MAKIYVGNGIEKTFEGGGSVIDVHLTLDKMSEYFKEFGYTAKNGDRRIKLKIGSRRTVGDYGETHTVEVDTWKPDSAQNSDPFGASSGQGTGNNSVNTEGVSENIPLDEHGLPVF